MNTACPSSEILKQFIVATLDDVEADELLLHLESCEECAGRLRELEQTPNEAVVTGFRKLHDKPLAADSTLPKQIGKYEVLEKIGEGGMGIVYRATNSELNRDVVVKTLKSSKLNDTSARSRFEQEIKTIGRLRHKNIVQSWDAGFEDGTPFIVMEWLDGCDLDQYVKQHGPMKAEKALTVIRQVADGLEHAHQVGLVHRDIKPSNLFLLHNGSVKLLDLGIAKSVDVKNYEKQTITGHVVGSPDFMAPEQFRGAAVDARSDIYSLGCTLAYLMTGKSLSESQGDLSEPVRSLVARMTAGMPDQRFQSACDLIEAIDKLATERTVFSISYRSIVIIIFALFLLFWGSYAYRNQKTDRQISPVQTPDEVERRPIAIPESVRKEATDNEALYKKTPEYQAYLKEKVAWEKEAAEHAKQVEAWKRDPRENPHPGPLESPPIPPERFAAGSIP